MSTYQLTLLVGLVLAVSVAGQGSANIVDIGAVPDLTLPRPAGTFDPNRAKPKPTIKTPLPQEEEK
jgi:hypothetical protein